MIVCIMLQIYSVQFNFICIVTKKAHNNTEKTEKNNNQVTPPTPPNEQALW